MQLAGYYYAYGLPLQLMIVLELMPKGDLKEYLRRLPKK